jgi:hypothetical protein
MRDIQKSVLSSRGTAHKDGRTSDVRSTHHKPDTGCCSEILFCSCNICQNIEEGICSSLSEIPGPEEEDFIPQGGGHREDLGA